MNISKPKNDQTVTLNCIFDLLLSDNNRLVLKNVYEKEINEKQKGLTSWKKYVSLFYVNTSILRLRTKTKPVKIVSFT